MINRKINLFYCWNVCKICMIKNYGIVLYKYMDLNVENNFGVLYFLRFFKFYWIIGVLENVKVYNYLDVLE